MKSNHAFLIAVAIGLSLVVGCSSYDDSHGERIQRKIMNEAYVFVCEMNLETEFLLDDAEEDVNELEGLPEIERLSAINKINIARNKANAKFLALRYRIMSMESLQRLRSH